MKDEQIKDKVNELQLIEQNLSNFMSQKQQFQGQLMETENALVELSNSKGTAYKIIGNVMIASDKDSLKKDLEDKQEKLNLRIKNIEKQEERMQSHAKELQNEVMGTLKKKND
ncbi:prefoldin subunit beta [Candidatus Woesearchaeota archaeon]|nr:prefoldin subunit beta [Candidatus Woesearchaeota archaeon]